jgi:hypothetical protein
VGQFIGRILALEAPLLQRPTRREEKNDWHVRCSTLTILEMPAMTPQRPQLQRELVVLEARRIIRVCRKLLREETASDGRARLAQLFEYAELVEQQAFNGDQRPSKFDGLADET